MPAFSSLLLIGGLKFWQGNNAVIREVIQEITAGTTSAAILGRLPIGGDAANGVASAWTRQISLIIRALRYSEVS